ncbi:unnamed protein product [Spirodela intermedia]|uniref:Uncharacterized protein n=2 Tax=Spirodela intermedia TaxID=51605 RepID=A0A7I8IP08_SPIIN|nr:unnamed protein product [Spirodela intermedia]CAA6659636.1 unnamed protein product [Spirodela intermedia]CAA7395971.1 unnamed protein product [Spirodela intermedia]
MRQFPMRLFLLGFIAVMVAAGSGETHLTTAKHITVTGCNNNCDVACCYCNTSKMPPVCEKCCHISRR